MKQRSFMTKLLHMMLAIMLIITSIFANVTVSTASDADFKQLLKPDDLADKQISPVFTPSEYGFDMTSVLGVPGYFHIFASGTYTQSTHVHGNFAAANYNGNGIDSGLREHYFFNNVDYAQKLSGEMNITPERDYVILGDSYRIEEIASAKYEIKGDSGSYGMFNNKISYIAVEKDTANSPFINFSSEMSTLTTTSTSVINAETSKYFLIKDQNNGGILLDKQDTDSDGVYVVNLKYSEISNMTQFYIRIADLAGVESLSEDMIKDFQASENKYSNNVKYPLFNFGDSSMTLLINIDMEGNADRIIPIRPHGWYNGPAVEYYENGSGSVIIDGEMGFDEKNILKKSSNILWNLHSNGSAYTGRATFEREWIGSVLAPNASLHMSSNAEGGYMCKDFSHSAETHVWYYTGKLPVITNETPEDSSEETTENPSDEVTEPPTEEDEPSTEDSEEPTVEPSEEPQVMDFSFVKKNEDGSKVLSEATFVLYGNQECTVAVGTAISGSDGVIKFEKLKDGTYYLKETVSPTGYQPSSIVYVVNIQDGNAVISSGSSLLHGNMTDGYSIYNKRIVTTIKLIKTYDDENLTDTELLKNTIFTLYSDYDGETLSNAVAQESPVWDNTMHKAVVSFRNITTPIGESETYYLKETQAPEAYTAEDDVYECHVNAKGEVTYRVCGSGEDFSQTFPICNNVSAVEDPESSSTEEPENSSTEEPENSSTEEPENSSTEEPENSSTEEPESSSTEEPENSSTEEPENSSTEEPESSSDENESTEAPIIDKEQEESVIKLIKTYDNKDLSTQEILDATIFTLYGSYERSVLSDIIDSATPIWNDNLGKAVVSFNKVKAPETGYVFYYLKETQSPIEYSLSDAVYICRISDKGIVDYRIYGSNDEFKEEFPICNNLYIVDPALPENPESTEDAPSEEENTENTENSDISEEPETSESSESTEEPETSESSESTEEPENSESSESTEEPETSESSESTEEPENSENSESAENSEDDTDSEDENDNSQEEEQNENPEDSDKEDKDDDSDDDKDDDKDSSSGSGEKRDKSEDPSDEDEKDDTKKDNSGQSSKKDLDDVPKTGDNFAVGWLIALVIISGAVMILAKICMKKEDYYELKL